MRILTFVLTVVGVLTGLLLLFYLFGGDPSRKRSVERAHLAGNAGTRDIQIAVVWPSQSGEDGFVRGLRLAESEINEAGGLLGRKVKLLFFDENEEVAHHIAKDPHTIGVIGYSASGPVLKHAIVYNREKMVFMMPFATNPHLTLKDFLYSFRTIPNDKVFSEWITKVALSHASDLAASTNSEIRTIILGSNDGYGHRFSQIFREIAGQWKHVENQGGITNTTTIKIVAVETYPATTTNFLPIIEEAKNHNFHAVVVADDLPRAGVLIHQLREAGVYTPILGASALDSPVLWNIASNRAFGVFFPSTFVWPLNNADVSSNSLLHSLVRRYESQFNGTPDFAASQGYEGLNLLAQAITRARSTVPEIVATVLEHVDVWNGLLEVYPEFQKDELIRSKLFIKYFASKDWPDDFEKMQPFIRRDLKAAKYTNHWHFKGSLLAIDTNKVVPILIPLTKQ